MPGPSGDPSRWVSSCDEDQDVTVVSFRCNSSVAYSTWPRGKGHAVDEGRYFREESAMPDRELKNRFRQGTGPRLAGPTRDSLERVGSYLGLGGTA